MTRRRKILLLLILLIFTLLSGWLWWYCRNHTLPRSGQVIDAETGKPIEGAIVCMQWKTGGFLGVAGPSFAALYETKTDSQGKYYVPSQHLKRRIWLEGVDDEEVLVYKDGYEGYQAFLNKGWYFGGEYGEPYHRRNNQVLLRAFNTSWSHEEHFEWIRVFRIEGDLKPLLEQEIQKEEERAQEDLRGFKDF